ncbi:MULTISPECIES: Rz-like lysis system protein LysB [Dickeya]|uniref:Cys-tRNA(Pro) deacylase YbaK n=1 Tax=Dickeya aquatica TaxID=1401087 RepID=A0A375A8X1_9GAMM|nr:MULTISPECIES: Rz-like lysis system protein LysB [Dickeya]SLM62401.1 Cys-tRNA(Pro) deacylase YbaK [Dickeya aquatica]
MKSGMLFIALMVLLSIATGVQSWRLYHARQLNEQQAQTLKLQGTALEERAHQLTTLAEQAARNNLEQARLQEITADTQAALSERQKYIARLQRENDALKRWADTALPDDIIRLHQRPAFSGARAYREWMSENNPLPLSGVQPANQR